MDMARVFLVGRLTKDPEILGEDQARRALFSVAVNRGPKDKRKTSFINVIAWGRNVDYIEAYATKGSPVVIDGQLEQDRWESKTAGKQLSKLQVNAWDITIFNNRGTSVKTTTEESEEELEVEVGAHGSDDEDVPF